MVHGATAQVMLMHQLAPMLHHTSAILQHKSLVHHPLEILKVPGLQSIGQSIIQAIQEAILLLLIRVHFIGSIVVTPSFKAKTECIPLCVPGWIFTHKAINSEINNITSVYYNIY
jgi:hypothetical protein